jgi:hypothetical protein
MNLKPLNPSNELESYSYLAKIETPLVVHFRFGDYVQEGGFGIPTFDYYGSAIEELWSSGNYNKIWVFSDEPEKVPSSLMQKYERDLRWIPMVSGSSVQTLEAMRMGYGFVIANSTFSWWAVYLGDFSNKVVVAPKVWFGPHGPKDYEELYHPLWIRV